MTTDEPLPEFAPPPQEESNGLGLAGFIVSLVGLLLTCGLLCPVGLVLSMFGLRREPRGFAIAGTAIGAVGSLLALFWGLAVVLAVIGIKKRVEHDGGASIQNSMVLLEAEQAIDLERADKSRLPTDAEGTKAIEELRDAWDHALRYELHGESYTIRSAGPDGAFDTKDDVTTVGR